MAPSGSSASVLGSDPKPTAPVSKDLRLRLLSAVNSMPPLPAVLNQLLGKLNDDNCSATQIADLIETDSILSGSVLRCVNSAYYGVANRVSSIRHAVTLLGFATVRNLALAFSMRRMMTSTRPPGPQYKAYSRHSLACALMCQFLAHFTRSPDVEAAFAAGLFHDIGRLLVLTTAADKLPEIIRLWEEAEGDFELAEERVLGVTHSELSGLVLTAWKLPLSIQQAARYHHAPEQFPESGEGEGPNLAELVSAADAAVNSLGFAALVSPACPPAPPDEAFARIGLASDKDAVLSQFQSQFEQLSSALS